MMKKTYYISLNPSSMDAVSEMKVPESGYQYEIQATEEEMEALQDLLTVTQAHDVDERNLLTFRHFDDRYAIADRNEYQEGLSNVFKALYELGTPETKQAIEEIHLNE
ncbi:hypothetical protein [Alteribacter aurantiacus]|uniref:hypothetical protein n=1 Tax=Alteribacter aurantiacus TaxID=254410 RepID=UPI00042597A8|nr:hypothetical protein [Alteribacter aurantiacus]